MALHVLVDHATDVPRLTVERVFTAWSFELLPLLAVGVVTAFYLWGVVTLRRRGDDWSVWRTLSFCLVGMGAALVATCSSLGTYDDTLLSIHMVQHMVLSMVVPVFMALGAPVTLALRTLAVQPRRVLLAVLHSRVAKVLTFPPLTFALFVANPWVLYFSGWYEATLTSDVLHNVQHLHFVVVGCLFFWPLLGLDPVPGRVAHPFRMFSMLATLPFHAFLGVTIMSTSRLIAGGYYEGLHRTWPPSPRHDQQIAGGILWASGDFVGLLVFVVLFVQWFQASQREAGRVDRALDRQEAARRTSPTR